jgi:O-antigen/teichoic acid export membrane protein
MLGGGRMKTASVVLFSHSFVAVTTLFQSIALARILPLHDFGLLSATLAIAGTAEAAINARGSETALAAFAIAKARGQEERWALARRLMFIDLLWSSCFYGLFLVATIIYDQLTGNTSTLLYGLMLGSLISFPWGTAKGYITVYLSSRKFAPGEVSYALVAFVVGPVLAYFLGPWGFVLGMIGASLFRSICGLWAIGFRRPRLLLGKRTSNEFSLRTIYWFGTTGTLRSLMINGLQQFDLILLAAFVSPSAVGLYRAAKTVSSIPQRLAQPVWVLLKGRIIDGAIRSSDLRRGDSVTLIAGLFLLVGVLAAPLLIRYADHVMALLFGPHFATAGMLLWWLLPAAWLLYGVTGWSSTFGSVSTSRAKVLGIYAAQLVTMVAVIALTGVTTSGVAAAVALSQILAGGFFWLLYLKGAKT